MKIFYGFSSSTSTYLINYFNNEGSVDVKKNLVKIKEDLIAREEEKILISRFGN